ncbi:FAD binding domain-containing protein [Streptomyces sp. NPDC057611]|uniref:FAD binding domain-containing protein n=1 Tax=Streptomyces sp. NPDC057611 TaxID=3346182 RepID=UPI0036C2A05F
MKPASFDYLRPYSRDEALSMLAEDSDESKVLSGGQSLVPMMNFRLARPSRLIDINHVPGLDEVAEVDGKLHIGARTRHLRLQNRGGQDPLSRLLRTAAAQIGHLPIRTRGTFGGSLAHCDAASEWCLVARLLDAEVTVEGLAGRRTIPAEDFFVSLFTTAMEPDELLVDVALPLLDSTHETGFAEFARRAGDFAIVAVTTDIAVTDGVVSDARVCIGGVSEVPFRSAAAEGVLRGADWSSDTSAEVVQEAAEAAAAEVSPPSDSHGDAEYRRDLVRAMLTRAVAQGAPAVQGAPS